MDYLRNLVACLAWIALIVQPVSTACACSSSATQVKCCCKQVVAKATCCAKKACCEKACSEEACSEKAAEKSVAKHAPGCQCDGCTCSISAKPDVAGDWRGNSSRVGIDWGIAEMACAFYPAPQLQSLSHYAPPYLVSDHQQWHARLCVWLN